MGRAFMRRLGVTPTQYCDKFDKFRAHTAPTASRPSQLSIALA
jgi:hypothetical protein